MIRRDILHTTTLIAERAAIRTGHAVFQLAVLEDEAVQSLHPDSYSEWLRDDHANRILQLIEEAAEEVCERVDADVADAAAVAVQEVIEYVDHALRFSVTGVSRITSNLTWWPTWQEITGANIRAAVSERMWRLEMELADRAA